MSEHLNIPLETLEDPQSSLTLDQVLEALPGVIPHSLKFHDHRLELDVDDAQERLPEIITAIRSTGGKVPTQRKQFPVTGMSCASCASSIQSTLNFHNGVVLANVNYANARAQVEYVEGMTNPEELRKSIQEIGFDLLTKKEESTSENLESLQKEHTRSLRLKTGMAALFSIPLLIIGMFFMSLPYGNFIMWALATPVVMIAGAPFFINAWKQGRHGHMNMDTLVAMSTGIAYLFSVFNTLFPNYWRSRGIQAHVYFEASAVVIFFILLGKVLEDRAKSNTSSAIKKLMGLQVGTVTLIQPGGQYQELPVDAVMPGDQILIRPGERFLVDGTVISGSSYVDESMLSGEVMPLLKEPGDKLYSGTINQQGSLQLTAEKVGADTVLAHIIRAVQDAQASKAPVQQLVDKIAGIFVPVVLVLAVITFNVWILWGGDQGISHGLMAMVTVLVIACPCALGLATPTAIMVGMGRGATNGILIKDAESLERSCKIDTIVFDKTGTITEGKPRLIDIHWEEGMDTQALGAILYGLEQASEHPLAKAIVQYYEKAGIQAASLEQFQNHPGLGVLGNYQGNQYIAGNQAALEAQKVSIPELWLTIARSWQEDARTLIWFAKDQELCALIAIADSIKTGSREAIRKLEALGITSYILSGDSEKTVKAVAEQMGIREYRSQLRPEDKAKVIQDLQAAGHIVGMAGDGINDSQALARANISIAMGHGSDIAMDVAGMTLISSDLNSIPKAIRLSAKTVQVIRQNLFWAFIYNLIGIPLAAGILYPVNGFLLNPMIAGAAMALSSVSVVSNSLRLRWVKL